MSKSVADLSPQDFAATPVWEFVNTDADETLVRPVDFLPVDTLDNRIIGCSVVLANGSLRPAMMGNVDPRNERRTRHFLTLSLFHDERWLHMARYHDLDHETNGPAGIAAKLGMPINEIFPIAYDLREFARGDASVLVGKIPAEPAERLARAALMRLAVG